MSKGERMAELREVRKAMGPDEAGTCSPCQADKACALPWEPWRVRAEGSLWLRVENGQRGVKAGQGDQRWML